MKTHIVKILAALIFLLPGAFCNYCSADTSGEKPARTKANENDLKAAFLYNFILFTDWPDDKSSEPNVITLGVLGNHPFGSSFDPIKNKTVKDKKLVIKNFGKFEDICSNTDRKETNSCANLEELKKCHLLFICNSETPNLKKIVSAVSDSGVLTVGECDEFLDAGGIINFIISEDKLTFEINEAAAKIAKIQINSRVLRLAKRIKK